MRPQTLLTATMNVAIPYTTRFAAIVLAFSLLHGGMVAAQRTGGGTTGGGTTGGGTTGGGSTGGGTTSGSDFRTADEAFADGVPRAGAPEASRIGTGGPEVTGSTSQQGRAGGGLGGLGAMGGFGGLGGLSQLFGGLGQSQQQQRTVRTRLASAVDVEPVVPQVVGQTVNARLDTIAARSRFTGINVQMNGRTAVVSGTVASEADRRMAVLLVRLEPGVRKVENKLEVAK